MKYGMIRCVVLGVGFVVSSLFAPSPSMQQGRTSVLLSVPRRSPARRRSRFPRPAEVKVVPERPPMSVRSTTPVLQYDMSPDSSVGVATPSVSSMQAGPHFASGVPRVGSLDELIQMPAAVRAQPVEKSDVNVEPMTSGYLKQIPMVDVVGEEPSVKAGGERIGERGRKELPPSPRLREKRELNALLRGQSPSMSLEPGMGVENIVPVAEPGASMRGTVVYGASTPAPVETVVAAEVQAPAAVQSAELVLLPPPRESSPRVETGAAEDVVPEGAQFIRIPGQERPVLVLPVQGPGKISAEPAETVVAVQPRRRMSRHGGMGAYPEGAGTEPAETIVAAPQQVQQVRYPGEMSAYPAGVGTEPAETIVAAPQPVQVRYPGEMGAYPAGPGTVEPMAANVKPPALQPVVPQVVPLPSSAGGLLPGQRIIWNPKAVGRVQSVAPVRKKGWLQRLGEAFAE